MRHKMTTKKKVLFIYHGGTIGQMSKMIEGKLVLVCPKDGKEFEKACQSIIGKLNTEANMNVTFEVMTTKDSTNMMPSDWEKLIYRIKKAQDVEHYDAVGIAHGTDTMAYTTTAVALGLHGKQKSGLRIPIVFTGAQNTIYERGGDGRFNLENLFRTIRACIEAGVADVVLNFWHRVLLGCRILKVSEKDFDAFHSPSYPDVGYIDSNGVHLIPDLIKKKANSAEMLTLSPKFGRGTISIELSPGLEPSTILGFIANGGISAMIFKSLGEGNVCSEGEYNLLPVIKTATEYYATPILLTTKFVGGKVGAAHYESGFLAIKAGGVPCGDHTDVAVEVKAKWLIGNAICADIEGYKKAMATSYAGEVTE